MQAEARLATTIDPLVDRRLRMQALLTGRALCDVVSDALDKALPPLADLARDLSAPAAAPAKAVA